MLKAKLEERVRIEGELNMSSREVGNSSNETRVGRIW